MTSTTLQRSETRRGVAFVDVGAGEPLVLVHGVGMRLEAWGPQLDDLATTHRVIAIDLPGHGASAPLPTGSPLAAFGTWLLDTLDDLGLDTVSLAGHSMGALLSGWVATSAPSRVRRVALLNGVHRRDAAAADAVRVRAAEIASGSLDRTAPLARWFTSPDEYPHAHALAEQCLRDVDLDGYATAYAAFAEGDDAFADRWPTVTVPALFLTGELDPNSTPAMAEAMAAAAPSGDAVVVPGHRHLVHLTAPDIVDAALRSWLSRNPPERHDP